LDDPGSMVEIKMPGNFTLPALDTVLTVLRITEKKLPKNLKAKVAGGGQYIYIYDIFDDILSEITEDVI